MRPLFHTRIINGPFEDPGLYVPFSFQNRAFIFDLGDISKLSARDILKISHAFVTHTHIDHFCGFDLLLRLFLGREKDFYIFGPKGFLKNLEGKLSGYTWNLVHNYKERFVIHAKEIYDKKMIGRDYECTDRFEAVSPVSVIDFDGKIFEDEAIVVYAQILDHGIPCLAFCLDEKLHVNIVKEKLLELGLKTGPWLKKFKEDVLNQKDYVISFDDNKKFKVSDLADKITIITKGKKIAYVADASYTPENIGKIVSLARESDHLFIEAAFLDEEDGAKKHHLTAKQAGSIAAAAKVKKISLFHFSPKHQGEAELFEIQADKAYKENILARVLI